MKSQLYQQGVFVKVILRIFVHTSMHTFSLHVYPWTKDHFPLFLTFIGSYYAFSRLTYLSSFIFSLHFVIVVHVLTIPSCSIIRFAVVRLRISRFQVSTRQFVHPLFVRASPLGLIWLHEGFLVADTRLYTLPCRSVGPSVRPSVTNISKLSIGLWIIAPAQPSATGLPCIRPCYCCRHDWRSRRRSMSKISHFQNQINITYLYIIVKVILYFIWIHLWNSLAGSNLHAN